MNTYNINNDSFKNSQLYQDFITKNPAQGFLRVRASAAGGAIPISGLQLVVSTTYNDNNIIMYEGVTNESGVSDKISLPTPSLEASNLDVPLETTYEIKATYVPDNVTGVYPVKMYEGVCVVQNINIVPNMQGMGDINGN